MSCFFPTEQQCLLGAVVMRGADVVGEIRKKEGRLSRFGEDRSYERLLLKQTYKDFNRAGFNVNPVAFPG